MNNINGYCKHCGSDMDGENIIQAFIDRGYTLEKALETASNYAGWNEYKEANCFGRQIGCYDINTDRTVYYTCPDCGGKL